jgi:hypothetical protein
LQGEVSGVATYRPATVDDQAVLARMARDRRRAAEAAASPGKTQVWQTTDKVAGASSKADAAQAAADEAKSVAGKAQAAADEAGSAADSAQAAADEAKSVAGKAQAAADEAGSAADSAQAAADAATLPVGACVLMATKTAPGLSGTWSLVTGVKLPMTGSDATYYVYERTA